MKRKRVVWVWINDDGTWGNSVITEAPRLLRTWLLPGGGWVRFVEQPAPRRAKKKGGKRK